MEGDAMRFLNHLGNVFFAKILSFILQTKLGDSLCGTKLLALHDYHRIVKWRKDFGDFDPFGDFVFFLQHLTLVLELLIFLFDTALELTEIRTLAVLVMAGVF